MTRITMNTEKPSQEEIKKWRDKFLDDDEHTGIYLARGLCDVNSTLRTLARDRLFDKNVLKIIRDFGACYPSSIFELSRKQSIAVDDLFSLPTIKRHGIGLNKERIKLTFPDSAKGSMCLFGWKYGNLLSWSDFCFNTVEMPSETFRKFSHLIDKPEKARSLFKFTRKQIQAIKDELNDHKKYDSYEEPEGFPNCGTDTIYTFTSDLPMINLIQVFTKMTEEYHKSYFDQSGNQLRQPLLVSTFGNVKRMLKRYMD